MKRLVKKILVPFRLSLFLYTATACVFFVVVDHRRVDIKTFNYLLEYDGYIKDFSLGKVPFSRSNTKKALRYYKLLMKYYPNIPTINNAVGFCYYHLGQYNKALTFFMKATVLYHKFFGFYYNSALIYIQQEEFAKAVPILKRALNVKPGPTLKYAVLGFPLNQPVDETQLQGMALRVKYVAQAYRQCFKWLLLCYQKTGDYENMRQTALVAIAQQKEENAIFYYYAGLANFHLGNEKQAVYFFEKCIQIDSSFEQAYDYLEQTVKKAGAPEMAVIIAAQKEKMKQSGLLSQSHADLNTLPAPGLFFYQPQRMTWPDGKSGFLL